MSGVTGRDPAAGPEPVTAPGRLGQRLARAVQGFVDDPRQAVKEADAALEEAVSRLERAVRSHREALEGLRAGCADGADTEALRVALTRYRDLSGDLAPEAPARPRKAS